MHTDIYSLYAVPFTVQRHTNGCRDAALNPSCMQLTSARCACVTMSFVAPVLLLCGACHLCVSSVSLRNCVTAISDLCGSRVFFFIVFSAVP